MKDEAFQERNIIRTSKYSMVPKGPWKLQIWLNSMGQVRTLATHASIVVVHTGRNPKQSLLLYRGLYIWGLGEVDFCLQWLFREMKEWTGNLAKKDEQGMFWILRKVVFVYCWNFRFKVPSVALLYSKDSHRQLHWTSTSHSDVLHWVTLKHWSFPGLK